ncbi:MAG TPA: antibiotic biosynthesis monooxygenase [Anaeromyxobacteraceae bacterium]|nr:antibiotic biosynthesis monooxygenase [Anaeromyxobacteraceae bacterium]
MAKSLLVVQVSVKVKAEMKVEFERLTLENAEKSRLEPGVVRFDVLADREDPARFLLIEVYRSEPAAAAHKQTPHYARWRDAVAGMMAEPRSSRKFVNLSPEDDRW